MKNKEKQRKIRKGRKMGIFDFNSSTLYFPGCFSIAKLEDKNSNYGKILWKLGVDYSSIDDIEEFICCAGHLVNAGYDKQSRNIARETFEIFKKHKIRKIITNCSLCHKTFAKDYPEIVPGWDVEARFILEIILEKLSENPGVIKYLASAELGNKILYHDACYLGRYSGIYDAPREILKLLGYELVELPYSKQEALCTGSCSGLKQTNPELANRIAADFLKQVGRTGIRTIVTADSHEYLHLKECFSGTSIKVMEFSDILCDAMEIWRHGR